MVAGRVEQTPRSRASLLSCKSSSSCVGDLRATVSTRAHTARACRVAEVQAVASWCATGLWRDAVGSCSMDLELWWTGAGASPWRWFDARLMHAARPRPATGESVSGGRSWGKVAEDLMQHLPLLRGVEGTCIKPGRMPYERWPRKSVHGENTGQRGSRNSRRCSVRSRSCISR